MNASKPKRSWILLALLPVLLLSACASQHQISASACPQLPSKPAAMQPAPPQSYSESAAQRIDKWQKRLTATLPTQSSASVPGLGE